LHHFRIIIECPHKFNQRSVDKLFTVSGSLCNIIQLSECFPNFLDIDSAFKRFLPAIRTKTICGRAGQNIIQRASSLITPHNSVDIIIPRIIFNYGMPKTAITGIIDTGFMTVATKLIHFQQLRHIRNGNIIRRTVSRIFKQRFHHFGIHFHSVFSRFGNNDIQNILSFQPFIFVLKICDFRISIIFGSFFNI